MDYNTYFAEMEEKNIGANPSTRQITIRRTCLESTASTGSVYGLETF